MSNFDLGQFLRNMQDELVGYVLDTAKVSEMGERQFQQFERSMKRYFRTTVDAANTTLRENKLLAGEFDITDRPAQGK